MTILAVGDEAESWSNPFTNSADVQTVTIDPGQRGGIAAASNVVWILPHAAVSEMWFHAKCRFTSTGTTNPAITFYNTASSKAVLKVEYATFIDSGRGSLRASYNNTGTSYVSLGDAEWGGGTNAEAEGYIDIYFKNGASGVFKLFIKGVLVLSSTGNYTTVDSTWDSTRLGSQSTGQRNNYGGVICADEPTLGMRLDHISPNGSGSVSTWSGNFNAVADASLAPRIDTTSSISSNTPGEAFLATMEDAATVHGSKEIRAVQIATSGLIEGGSGITSVSNYARESGVNYTLGNLGLTSSQTQFQEILNTSPAGNAWTDSIVNSLELGVISA